MRKITHIVIHCSDSEWGNATVIRSWHKEKGWRDIGYHFVIQNGFPTYSHYKDDKIIPSLIGSIEGGRDLDSDMYMENKEVGAHAFGYNQFSIGVCIIGKEIFVPTQLESLKLLCLDLCKIYDINPQNILGHNETPSGKAQGKTCPNFEVQTFRNWVARIEYARDEA